MSRRLLQRSMWRMGVNLLASVSVNAAANAQVPVHVPTRVESQRKLDFARAASKAAQTQQKAGLYRQALAEYSQAIDSLSGMQRDEERGVVLASAHFGRGDALQQERRRDTGEGPVLHSGQEIDESTALHDYDEAIALDSARYFSAAHNNAGMLLHDLGKHREALARFLSATRSPHPARGAFFAHAGDEFLELELPNDAAQAYRSALADDSTLAPARAGLLRALSVRSSADSLLRVASRWTRDASHAPQVIDAMYDALITGKWRGGPVADSCLELLAANFAVVRLGPPDIARVHADRLRRIAAREPGTRRGVDALMAAYSSVPTTARRPPGTDLPNTEWWTRTNGRRAVWSTLLGSIGRWYDARGADSTAVAYYEAALGMPWQYNEPPEWIDIEIIFPLAVLYASGTAQHTAPIPSNAFLDGVFHSKMLAYQERDVPRIRRFHTALGAFFASRGEWKGEPRGAIFQLESMRRSTRQLNVDARGAKVFIDTPELLQQLVNGYCATGEKVKAEELAREIAAQSRVPGRIPPGASGCATSTAR